jgi:hypothetical protein
MVEVDDCAGGGKVSVTRLRQREARNDLTLLLHRAGCLGLGRRAWTATRHCMHQGFVTTGVNRRQNMGGRPPIMSAER